MATDKTYEWLKEQSGLTDDELKAYENLLGDGKVKMMLTKIQAEKESAAAERAKAEEDRLALEKQWSDVYQPELRKVTQDALAAAGREAKLKAELEQARKYGIVPPEEVNPNPEVPRAPGSPDPQYATKDDFARLEKNSNYVLAKMNDLNAKHFKLFGEPVPDFPGLVDKINRERALNHAADPDTIWEQTYNVPAKRAELAAAEKAKERDTIRAEYAKEIAEKGGINPNLTIGRPSRFSSYDPSKMAENTKPWERPQGMRRASNAPWRDNAVQKMSEAALRGGS